ncbi:uncharacterized protein CLUP02_00335 [Colletotrichum lupini]|uniref:Uncharacterized protein n=1 Tax=Colletotrichum lupini TaxID=145971 RepID=A0A9Q8W7Z6_9PEZI|nr:uncharacterized protein CLUP02_00335 [Colletotrichum lupini]UQC73689.1 hypothetical protein CLUP02_00335 [Colletotrichum lupini]
MPKVLRELLPGLKSLYARIIDYISNSKVINLYKEVLAVILVIYRLVILKELLSIAKLLTLFTKDLKKVIKYYGSFLILRNKTIYFIY